MTEAVSTPAQAPTDAGQAIDPNTAQPTPATPAPTEGTPAPSPADPASPGADQAGAKDPEPKAPEAKTSAVPEKYELKIPDGSLLDPKAIERVSALAKSQGLTNDQAQALLENENQAIATYVQDQEARVKERTQAWIGEMSQDQEIGGANYRENAELSKRVISRFATPEFQQTLDSTGLGNHPELVRTFVRIGKLMGEDKLVIPGSQNTGTQSLDEKWFPNTKSKE